MSTHPRRRIVDDDQDLLTVAQTARILKRSTEQVRRYLREERIPGQRMGGQWFIKRSAVTEFADAVKVKQTFLTRVGPARTLRPLDSVIGITDGNGLDVSKGKRAFLRHAASRSR
jgi:excisionase family DNA binding protein